MACPRLSHFSLFPGKCFSTRQRLLCYHHSYRIRKSVASPRREPEPAAGQSAGTGLSWEASFSRSGEDEKNRVEQGRQPLALPEPKEPKSGHGGGRILSSLVS